MKIKAGWWVGALLAGVLSGAWISAGADTDLPTKFTNRGSIANTRHNMTQRQPEGTGPNGSFMDPYRNDYQEVCVYCHTPHGANANVAVPLWNRTIKATSYTTYNQLGTSTLTQQVTQPGANSLACLSCHDGQVGIDSIINMPGSGKYDPSQATSQSDTFLNAWTPGTEGALHIGLSSTSPQDSCLVCHSAGAGVVGRRATDFTVFALGTDLRNDHPVGVRFPTVAPGVDFKPPTASRVGVAWFDNNGNLRPDTNEVRMYDSGQGFEVECASCHDPHGVPSAGAGSSFNPTFLRVTNTGSTLCLTCHTK
jgi:hypothetical protein